jgi:membrane protein GlpM
VIKAALGALVVLLIGILAKTKTTILPGYPLFPTFALIAHYIVALSGTALRTTIVFGMWSIIRIFSTCFRCGISPVFCVFPWR